MNINYKGLIVGILSILGLVYSINGYSQEAYIKYTVNGKVYNFKGNDVRCYQKNGDRDDEDKVAFTQTSIYVSSNSKTIDQLGILIRSEKGKKLEVGNYIIQDLIDQTEVLPNANLRIDRNINDKYEFYGTLLPTSGTFHLTKVDGVWIEGTFEAELTSDFDDNNGPLKVTNGSFRVQLKDFME